MKVAFFGTPDFAVPSLRALVENTSHKVVCVVAQPDKPSGRGGEVILSPVKQYAADQNIPVLQPEKISNELHILEPYAPDIIVTCAFGQILKQNVLDYPRYGVINVHASLLPKYRGSAPIQWAIINGEQRTGITIMQTDIGLDTGDIILQMPLDIAESETAGELFIRLSELGASALVRALSQIEEGTALRVPQNNLDSSIFPRLRKEDGKIHWTQNAVEIANMIRGMNPWPVAFFPSGAIDVRVWRATPFSLDAAREMSFIDFNSLGIAKDNWFVPFGAVVHASSAHGLFVMCKASVLRLDTIQIPGGRAISTRDFLNGRTFAVGTVLM